MEERLSKYLENAGIAARRKVEEYISDGKVKVNGEFITQQGFKINSEKDIIEFEGKVIKKDKED